MNKIFGSVLFLLLTATFMSAQQIESSLFRTSKTPDSIVQIRTILPGTTIPQTVTVEVTNGLATLEGDIILGRIEALQHAIEDRGIIIAGDHYRWPDANIPFQIGPGFTPEYISLIKTCIAYINGSTHLWLREDYLASDRVLFIPSIECSSYIGRQGGVQGIHLKDIYAPGNGGNGCDFRAIIHEIAHAAGLWHEHSRIDRDSYVTINWANIEPSKVHNFNKHISDGIIIGPYDFASVMHYSSHAFSSNNQPTIIANGGQPFGNATEYSNGDIATINWLYPDRPCVVGWSLSETIPPVSQPIVFEGGWSGPDGGILSIAKVLNGNRITYDGQSKVILHPGFQAEAGSVFLAVIEGCGGYYQMQAPSGTEEWRHETENKQQQQTDSDPFATNIAMAGQEVALDIKPNPFTIKTIISYEIPTKQTVDIQIFNAVGNLVAQPVQQAQQEAGTYEFSFEANGLPTGVYILVMQTDGQKRSKRLVLTK